MTAQGFCQNCGAPRAAGSRFCGSCGRPYDGAAEPLPVPAGTANTAALLAGIAWLISAVLIAYLAYQQWVYFQAIQGTGLNAGDLGATAGWNAISAAITLYFGARILTKPTPGLLRWSVSWAVIDVGWGLLQVGQGILSDLYVLSMIAAAAAGVLSFVARASVPGDAPAAPASASQPPDPTAPTAVVSVPAAPPARPAVLFAPRPLEASPAIDPATVPALVQRENDRTSAALVLAVVLTGLLALAVVGFAVLQGPGQDLLAGLSPTPSPTATPSPTPTPIPLPTLPPIYGTGLVTFGKDFDPETLSIVGPATKFKTSAKAIAWSAALTGPVGATSMTFILASQSKTGVEKTIHTEDVEVSNPQANTFAIKLDLAALAENKAGTYVLRLVRNGTVLAEGTFTLTK